MSYECVLQCGEPCKSFDSINQGKWESLQSKAKNWSGHDKFGNVYTTTSWQDGQGGDYIEAAISSLGISDEQLLQNLAQLLSKKIKDTTTVPWPPCIDHLEEGEEVCELLLKLLTWLKQPERNTADISPATLSLASMITYHITGQRTTTAIDMGVNVHGMTRSKDLVETLHKSGVSISYADTLFLYDHWALMDLKHQQPAHRRLQTASQPL
ncbi:8-amino-38-dideoxy-manno-octulosonate cytidylyltransferase [Dissostichus eleginoides]|uniref:8-amino-38-dideoxy-manno-octulosonate cytidylyltransferase n=1 Tax=Dissostichus eleginoides TaxID=100907 RepID=A0AAD9FDG2_DISEL|nr:8-amino-38-dideoxy-manno-octulosonate cytidylyltransferase [Dissostichus eleginoides]